MYLQNERPRRLRNSHSIRELVSETSLTVDDLIYPIFIQEGTESITESTLLPGVSRYTLDKLPVICDELVALGIKGCALFPSINESKKDSQATEGLNPENIVCQAIRLIKSKYPNLLIITDIALDPYSSDGHDGIVKDGEVLNDETVEILAEMAVLHAKAGADIVAPSDMMDGRVGAIREALEESGHKHTMILSYTAKYASHFYGPFRDALDSAPKAGDKKSYQMDYRNKKEAVREALLDEQEGADILMVKPASMYLDIILTLSEESSLPIAAYHVSGEYAMLKAAEKAGALDYDLALLEVLVSMKRAGASLIFSYAALDAARLLSNTR